MARFKDPLTKYYLALMLEEYNNSYVEYFAANNLWVGLFRIIRDIIKLAFRLV